MLIYIVLIYERGTYIEEGKWAVDDLIPPPRRIEEPVDRSGEEET